MAAYHHGGFYQAQLALALDHFRLAVTQVARLSTSRLSSLNEPGFTRLRPFLADDVPASSGVMILEYAAGAALGDLRAFSAPASLGHAVLSRGVEEQASFASLAARQTLRACRAYRLVVGCELVAAVRALRQRGLRPEPELPVCRRAGARRVGAGRGPGRPAAHGRRDGGGRTAGPVHGHLEGERVMSVDEGQAGRDGRGATVLRGGCRRSSRGTG